MLITKADGTAEPFSEEKVIRSIHRSGINSALAPQILDHVKSKLHEGITTREIYRHITEFLGRSKEPFSTGRYTLKKAIMDLGPTGYPFEDYVAKLLHVQEFSVATRSIIHGRCITHEIDVIATKENQKVLVEAKFHNGLGIKTDVHVALYTKARFDDVSERNNFTSVMLITNTKATSDAVSYAHCVGMSIISWSYPEGNSLRDLVEKHALYPITSLTTISTLQKQQLLSQDIVLVSDICKNPHQIQMLGLSQEKEQAVVREAGFLCNRES